MIDGQLSVSVPTTQSIWLELQSFLGIVEGVVNYVRSVGFLWVDCICVFPHIVQFLVVCYNNVIIFSMMNIELNPCYKVIKNVILLISSVKFHRHLATYGFVNFLFVNMRDIFSLLLIRDFFFFLNQSKYLGYDCVAVKQGNGGAIT